MFNLCSVCLKLTRNIIKYCLDIFLVQFGTNVPDVFEILGLVLKARLKLRIVDKSMLMSMEYSLDNSTLISPFQDVDVQRCKIFSVQQEPKFLHKHHSNINKVNCEVLQFSSAQCNPEQIQRRPLQQSTDSPFLLHQVNQERLDDTKYFQVILGDPLISLEYQDETNI